MSTTVKEAAASTRAASRALRREEAIIERGRAVFIEVGQALRRIRDKRLYQPEYTSFDQYVSKRWGFEKSFAHGHIAAADVAEIAETAGLPAPPNERTARELVKVMNREGRFDPRSGELKNPDRAVEAVTRVWEQATKDKGEFEKATAREVAEIVNPPTVASAETPLQMLGHAADALTVCEKRLNRLCVKNKGKPSKRMMDSAKKYAHRANEIADRFAEVGLGEEPRL